MSSSYPIVFCISLYQKKRWQTIENLFFHRKIQRFFSAKVWFSEGLRCILGWGFCRSPMRFFSNNENMVGGSLIQHCEFSMKILRLTMKSWGLQWLFGYLQWKSGGLRWDGFFFWQLLYAGSPMVLQRWRFYRRLVLKSNLIYLSVPLWFSYFSFQKMINSTQLIHPSFKVLLKSSKLKTKSRNGSPNF